MTGPGVHGRERRPIRKLPDALARREEIRERLAGGPVAVFLDYDGTLAPIVDDPGAAALPSGTRDVLARLAGRCPVAILSGRDLEDVVDRVGLERLHYAGSHGFDLRAPDGLRERRAEDRLPALDGAEAALREELGGLAGVEIERKRFGVAVHVRRAGAEATATAEDRLEEVAGRHPGLALHHGKQVHELRPAAEWDKGRALERLLEHMGLDRSRARPVYVGDDVTDEDAFRAVADGGVGIVVRGEGDDRPTRAAYALAGPEAVRRFLEALAGMLEARAG